MHILNWFSKDYSPSPSLHKKNGNNLSLDIRFSVTFDLIPLEKSPTIFFFGEILLH